MLVECRVCRRRFEETLPQCSACGQPNYGSTWSRKQSWRMFFAALALFLVFGIGKAIVDVLTYIRAV